MAQMSNRGAKLFCSLFIVIGVVVAGIGLFMLFKSLRTERWPVTGGVVLSAEMASHSGSKGGTTYSAEVTYSYRVGDASFTGDKVSIGQMSSSSDYAKRILNRYPIGKKVSVHYAPDDPSEAVLETGIHGGTWIAIGVGTVFVLFGTMFLQIQMAAAKAQTPGVVTSPITVQPDGSIGMDKPPALMGVIFLLIGIGLCFVPADSGKPGWIMFAVGAMFSSAGLMLLLTRLENKIYSKMAMLMFLVPFLAIFHWISFGAGDRTGTATTPFSVSHLVNVRTPFAIFTIFLDLVLAAGLVYWLIKQLRK